MDKLYLAFGALAVLIGSYCLGYYAGLEDRPATVPCLVEIPSFTKGQTFFRATTCSLTPSIESDREKKGLMK